MQNQINQIEEIKRHAPLLDRPLTGSMGQEVLDYLSRLTPLPTTGCVAGQSVMSALLALYPSKDHRGHAAPIKDVDIFYGAQDRYIENGQFEILKVNQAGKDVDSRIPVGEYKRVFEKQLNIENLHVVGLLNLIEMVPGIGSGEKKSSMDDIERLDTVLSEFDLSLVQVGVDLKTGQMRWMPAFEEFVGGAPVQAQDIGLAERSWIRYQRKRDQMPWLSWDDAQIKSAVQLTQARTYALLSGDERIPKQIAGWENILESRKISPVWDWKECSSQDASFAEIDRMRHEKKFSFTPADEVLFDSFLSIYSPSSDPHSIKINSDDPSTDLNLSKDLLRGLIRSKGNSQTLMHYIAAGGSLLHGAGREEMRLGRRSCLIHDAINWNKHDVVDLLLNKGFSPNDRQSVLGNTAYLQLSIRSGNHKFDSDERNLDLLSRMRAMGADVTLPVGLKSTVLHNMVKDIMIKNTNDVSLLVKRISEHTEHRQLKDEFGRMPYEVIRVDEFHLTPGGKDEKGRKRGQEIINFFTGTPVEIEEKKFSDMLLDGCDLGVMNDVNKALEQGALVNRGKGAFPLFTAAYRGHLEIVDKLLDAGADHAAKEEQGRTALMISSREGHVPVMKALLKGGALLEDTDESGDTALVHAIAKGKKESVDFLIQQGAKVDMVVKTGMRLIERAALFCYEDSPAIILSLSSQLEKQFRAQTVEEILIRSKEIAKKSDNADNVAVIDSILARMSIDQLLMGQSLKQQSLKP